MNRLHEQDLQMLSSLASAPISDTAVAEAALVRAELTFTFVATTRSFGQAEARALCAAHPVDAS